MDPGTGLFLPKTSLRPFYELFTHALWSEVSNKSGQWQAP
jgi:hypothetical protein